MLLAGYQSEPGHSASRTPLNVQIYVPDPRAHPVAVLFAYTLCKATLRYPEINGGDMIFLLGYALAGSIFVAILWATVSSAGS
jgi:hypothetical protein